LVKSSRLGSLLLVRLHHCVLSTHRRKPGSHLISRDK